MALKKPRTNFEKSCKSIYLGLKRKNAWQKMTLYKIAGGTL